MSPPPASWVGFGPCTSLLDFPSLRCMSTYPNYIMLLGSSSDDDGAEVQTIYKTVTSGMEHTPGKIPHSWQATREASGKNCK